jgi:transposase
MVAMYVERIPNRSSPPAILLREAWREAGKIRKRTLANLSHWPDSKVESLRRLLRGETLVGPQDVFAIDSSRPHGHVEAVLGSIRKLGLETLIASKPSRERELVVAMIAERLLTPSSKLATTRLWNNSTLAEELSVGDADVDELYQALDWLLARQPRIEAKLAARHLQDGALVLYDTTTSYYEGRSCSLARFGHDRDGKKLPVILYGLLTDPAGRPLAVEVYPGNTGDPTTVGDQVEKLRGRFSLSRVVIVGDRGMLTQAQIEKLKQHPGLGWISSLRSHAIRSLVETGQLERSLFDETNLAEIRAREFPGERLIACFNPLLAGERRRKREELLQATERALVRLEAEVKRRTKTPLGKAEIGLKAGRVLGRFKMGKHFTLTIAEGVFAWARREESIRREADLDGIYVVRTSEPPERLSAPDAVRSYKSLALVERAFRCLKGVDLLVRPIFHHTEDHVRAHVFLCMLAYYVEWHMREAWAPLLFQDEELSHQRTRRDPVAPAQPSPSARRKKSARPSSETLPPHSFKTLLAELARRCRNTCRLKNDTPSSFTMVTDPTPLQARALQLLGL